MLRIIGGTIKGKKLFSVPGDSTRPMLGRLKTSIFDILRPSLVDAKVLDLFAGTGSLGIEALSQGASNCVFIDINKKAYHALKKNIEISGFNTKAEIRNTDAFSYIKNTSKLFDLIFLDPPYFKALGFEMFTKIVERPSLLSKNGIVMLRVHPDEREDLETTGFTNFKTKKMGNSSVAFYKKL